MRISFDLDDTLICYGDGIPAEPPPGWFRRWLISPEPLRFGARSLIRRLAERGWDVWILTTSNRSPRTVRRWLRAYGIRIGRVINQTVYERHLGDSGFYNPPSKHPGLFGIDLHVDDSDGVRIEGEQHGFRVVVVSPDDEQWTETVFLAAEKLWQNRNKAQ